MIDELKEKLKQPIALYQTEYGSIIILEVNKWREEDTDMVRLTESLQVQFTPRKHEEMVVERVAQLNSEITKTRAESEARVTELTRIRNDLLALPNPDEGQ